MDGVQKIIDRIFYDSTRKYLLVTTFVFIGGFIIPFLMGEFNLAPIKITKTICSITMVAYTTVEVADICGNPRSYLKSFWNCMDLSLIISWYSYYVWTAFIGFGEVEQILNKGTNESYTDTIVKMNMLRVLIISLSFLKIVSFCRVFEGFAALIYMLRTVMTDLWDF